jgi:Ni/Co efflux regulator RcnB
MKSTVIACAIAAASMGFGSLSYAQGYNHGDRDWRTHDRQGYASQDGRGGHRDSREAWQRGHDRDRHYEHRRQLPQYSQGGQYSHYGQQGRWSERAPQYQRGDYLPYQFRQRAYYVNDWRAHRLYAPPRGYQWVQADNSGDYLMIAVATGLIANLLIDQ